MLIWLIDIKAIILPKAHWADVVLTTLLKREVVAARTLVHGSANQTRKGFPELVVSSLVEVPL